MVTTSEATNANTPTTKTVMSALPTSRNGSEVATASSRGSSASSGSAQRSSSAIALYPSGAMYPTNARWVMIPATVAVSSVDAKPKVAAV